MKTLPWRKIKELDRQEWRKCGTALALLFLFHLLALPLPPFSTPFFPTMPLPISPFLPSSPSLLLPLRCLPSTLLPSLSSASLSSPFPPLLSLLSFRLCSPPLLSPPSTVKLYLYLYLLLGMAESLNADYKTNTFTFTFQSAIVLSYLPFLFHRGYLGIPGSSLRPWST